MDSKTLLMESPKVILPTEKSPRLDYRDLSRSVVLISSFRSGSHMLKLSLGKLANMLIPPEPFNHAISSHEGYTVANYLNENGPRPSLMTSGNSAVHHFLSRFYAELPPQRRIIMDIKYPQAYGFGVNADMDKPIVVPVILEELHKLKIPFVHLTRRDVVAQAVSLMTAEETGVYLVKEGDQPALEVKPTRLSPAEVLMRARRLHNATNNAKAVMDALGVRCHDVTYEALTSDRWKEEYRAIFKFLDQYADIPQDFVVPTLRQGSVDMVTNIQDIRNYVAEREPSFNG